MTQLFSNALLRTQSDERLVRLVSDGHERAFEAIVNRYRKPLHRYCSRALSPSRAEDVVQQVFMKAWVALRGGTDVRSLGPWLYGIARTTALETARVQGFDYAELRRSLLPSASPDAELEQQTVIRKTLTGLAALPEAQREALLRAAFEGQSRAEIAEALGVSEGAVRQLLYRARSSLRGVATVVTPLPFASWLATTGSGSAAGPAVESAAAGSVGFAALTKASAVFATASVVAAGAGGVRQEEPDGAKAPRAETAKKASVKVRRAAPAIPLARRAAPAPARRPSQDEDRSRKAERAEPEGDGGSREAGDDAPDRVVRERESEREHEPSGPTSVATNEPSSKPATRAKGPEHEPQDESSESDSGGEDD